MANDQWLPQPYSEQELLSFERLKRAVMSRVLDRAEILLEDEFPLSPDRTTELTREEWERAKDAVRASPAARKAYREHLEAMVSDQIDGMIKTDRAELGSLGVAEKSL
ncbi:MAG: hypothetical protein P8105_13600 [Dehalococcoidia bacterium]|jgi:hypothetical protein